MSEAKLIISRKVLRLKEVIEPCMNLLKYTAEQKGLNIAARYDASQMITVDERRIKQVLINLLSNAVKFTEPGGCIIVTAKEKRMGDSSLSMNISVKDNGAGIKEEDLPKLFTEFGTLPAHQAMNPSGTGLGLFLSLRLIRLMNGDILVKSVFGKGSKFTVSIPMQTPTAVSESGTVPSPKYKMGAVWKEKQKVKVLLADDNHMSSLAIKSMLCRLNVACAVAYNGKDAIQMALERTAEYSAIFMDINMPVMTGTEAAKILKEMMLKGELKEAPIIAISGDDREYIENTSDFDLIGILFFALQ